MSEDAPELTAELVVDGALPSQPVISPDGRWVAYVVAAVGRRAERRICALWVAAADGGSPPGKLTAGKRGPLSAKALSASRRTGRSAHGSPSDRTGWFHGHADERVLTACRATGANASATPPVASQLPRRSSGL